MYQMWGNGKHICPQAILKLLEMYYCFIYYLCIYLFIDNSFNVPIMGKSQIYVNSG